MYVGKTDILYRMHVGYACRLCLSVMYVFRPAYFNRSLDRHTLCVGQKTDDTLHARGTGSAKRQGTLYRRHTLGRREARLKVRSPTLGTKSD